MKKLILAIGLLFVAVLADAQTFPVNNLTVAGTATFAIRPTFNGNTPYDTGNLPSFAPSVSPVFTGVPSAPTAALGTNTLQLATTAFVANHSSCPSILDYGGDATGTNDNTAALTATLAAGPATNLCAFFPRGRYKFLSQQVITASGTNYASVSLIGAGSESTVLTWPTTAGIQINLPIQTDVIHVRGMTLTSGRTAGGVGLGITQTSSSAPNAANAPIGDITDVALRGDDGAGNFDYWNAGISITGQSNINFLGVIVTGTNTFQGTGLTVQGSASVPPVVFNVALSTFNYLNVGINYGNFVQGLTVSQSNFTGDNFGISSGSSLSILVQLAVNNSQFNCQTAAMNFSTGIPDTVITGNAIFIPGPATGGAIGINFSQTHRGAVTGNSFTGFGTIANINGIVVANNIAPMVITGNSFNGMGTAVFLQSTSNHNNVQANVYSSVTNTVVNAGTSNSVGVATQ